MSLLNKPRRVEPPENSRGYSDPSSSIASRLEESLRGASQRAALYEAEMKDLESKLAENLSNYRAVGSLLSDDFTGLQRNMKRADRARTHQVPRILGDLQESKEVLEDLEQTLPVVQRQLSDIRTIYDSGRQKAQYLVEDLRWMNTEFYERWRLIVFTSSSPVSWRWKAMMRTLFVVSFVLCTWFSWIALKGAYRAYRHRLVWGDKLMS